MTKIEKGSGDVFADGGVANPELALAKAEIARRIGVILKERKLNQTQAAEILRIGQPRVSDLVHERLGRFSLENLIDFAKCLGTDVEIRMKSSTGRKARLRVSSAKA